MPVLKWKQWPWLVVAGAGAEQGGEGSSDLPGLQRCPDTGSVPDSGTPLRGRDRHRGPRLLTVEQGMSFQAPPETAEVNFVVNVNFRSRGWVLKRADTTLSLCILVPLVSN